MAITYIESTATVNGSAAGPTLGPGTTWAHGDLRLIFVTCPTSRTFDTTPAGWTKVLDQLYASSGRVALFTRLLQAGDTDQALNYVEGSAGIGICRATLRGADTTQLATPNGSSSSGTISTALSITPSVAGELLTFHTITRTSGGTTATFTDPSGMTRRAFSPSDASTGYQVLLASETRTAGAGATSNRNAVGNGAGVWRAATVFVTVAVPGPVSVPPCSFVPVARAAFR